ncbi:MAG TPA: hypothetical protein PLX97_07685 [Gemmatales bacterium]|nr:hypothetical protein [Gemmatales bacterium]
MNLAIVRPQKLDGVLDYFEQFPIETLGPVLGKGGNFFVQFGWKDPQLDLEGIGKAITMNCVKGDSVVIVCHGTPTDLMIPMGAGSKIAVNHKTLALLNQVLVDPMTDRYDQIGHELGFDSMAKLDHFDKLVNYFIEIRKLQLRHVAYRACRIGQDLEFLAESQTLFGCKNVSAPLKRDFFAQVTPKLMSTRDIDALIRKHPDGYVFGKPGKRIYISYKMTGHSSADIGFKMESVDAVKDFMAAKFKFNDEKQYKKGGKIALHGLWNEGAAPYFYFPTDVGYFSNLRTWDDPLSILPLYIPEERTGVRGLIDRIRDRRQSRKMHRAAS